MAYNDRKKVPKYKGHTFGSFNQSAAYRDDQMEYYGLDRIDNGEEIHGRGGYDIEAEEKAILARRKLRGQDEHVVEQVTSPKKVVAMQKALETVHVDPAILSYIIEIVQRTREDHRVINGASPRASQALFKTGRAAAAVAGRNYVIPDDIKGIALQIISHRINMKPEAKIRGITGMHIVRKILSEVPVPVIQPA